LRHGTDAARYCIRQARRAWQRGRTRAQTTWLSAPRSVCSPPPCGEGLGVGVGVAGPGRVHQLRPPPRRFAPTLPTRGRVGGRCSRCVLLLALMLLALVPLEPDTFCPTITDSLYRSRGAFFASGFCFAASLTPDDGVGGAPRVVGCLRGTR